MGTSDFAIPALRALCGKAPDVEVALVVSQPDRPRGRGKKLTPTPVKKVAEELGIKVATPDKIRGNSSFCEELKSLCPDLIVVASYGKILPSELLAIPILGCVNIHASLLPKYRGAAPIQWAIADGNEETGISLMYMAEGLDEGDVIVQQSVEIGSKNAGQVTEELAELGAKMLVDLLPEIEAGKAKRIPQNHELATYARMLTKEDGHIDWSKPAEVIARRIQGMTPVPGAWTNYGEIKMKVLAAHVAEKSSYDGYPSTVGQSPGSITGVSGEGIEVQTGSGKILIDIIGVPGKKPLKVGDYLRGNEIDNQILLS
jgi:methionyl-tRNA formyltransferase